MNWSAIRYFKRHEWCQNPDFASDSLVYALDRVRRMAGVPCIIHECYAEDGHTPDSYHYRGKAVDFHFATGLTALQEFLCLSAQPEIGAIGLYPQWTPRPGWHVDIRPWETGRIYWIRGNHDYHYGWIMLSVQLEKLSE